MTIDNHGAELNGTFVVGIIGSEIGEDNKTLSSEVLDGQVHSIIWWTIFSDSSINLINSVTNFKLKGL